MTFKQRVGNSNKEPKLKNESIWVMKSEIDERIESNRNWAKLYFM